MMKTHLYYFNWQLQVTIANTLIDDLMERDFKEEKLYYLTCNGCLNICWSNLEGKESVCKKCRFFKKGTNELIKDRITNLLIEDYVNNEDIKNNYNSLNLDYKTVNEIKNIEYRDVKIGYGALSTYFSRTRNREPVIDSEFRKYFNKMIYQGVMLTDAINKVIEEIKPETITIFNGRTIDVRPVFDTAINKNIYLRGVENIELQSPTCVKDMYYNALPQDVKYRTEIINKLWEESPLNYEEKEEIANKFYNSRRNGKKVRDTKAYTEKQIKDLLPNDWDKNKINIAIFNSSEDEVGAIPEFDQKDIYENQEDGIKFILQNINDNKYHFYLRIHPNLTEVNYGYHKRLYELEKTYNNITVIPGDSKISTYKIMEEADKVIVFGSTMGVESCYWNKSVIACGLSLYYYLDVTYNPKSKNDVIKLIKDNLLPKSKTGAIKYGYYLMDFKRFTTSIKLIPREFKLFGKLLGYTHPHMTFWGSEYLMKFIILILYTWPEQIAKKSGIKEESIIPRKGY